MRVFVAGPSGAIGTRLVRQLIEGANAADLYGVDVKEFGALLPGPDATLAGPTFEDWLGEGT